jgi:hypothetical protein
MKANTNQIVKWQYTLSVVFICVSVVSASSGESYVEHTCTLRGMNKLRSFVWITKYVLIYVL